MLFLSQDLGHEQRAIVVSGSAGGEAVERFQDRITHRRCSQVALCQNLVEHLQSKLLALSIHGLGDTIRVEPGTYHENLWVHSDGIHLVGAGPGRTVLLPPGSPTPHCDDATSLNGVCVARVTADGTPVTIHGFGISGFSIDGFAGFGVIVFGTQGADIERNEVTSPGTSGAIASFDATGTRIVDNTTTGSNRVGFGNGPDEAGIIVGDILYEFGGHPLKTPADLQAALAGRTATSTVEIKLYRGTTDTTVKARF